MSTDTEGLLDPRATLRAILASEMWCHCNHRDVMQERVVALKERGFLGWSQ